MKTIICDEGIGDISAEEKKFLDLVKLASEAVLIEDKKLFQELAKK